jgi:hypothetical protein
MSASKVDDNIGAVLDGILRSVDDHNVALYERVADHPSVRCAAEHARAGDFEKFYFALLHPLETAIEGLLLKECPGERKLHFLFRQQQFVGAHFRYVLVLHEGHCCSADKVRMILSALARFHATGQPISFEPADGYTFHLPKSVFMTHAQCVEFFDGVYDLYYGRPERYLLALGELIRGATGTAISTTPSLAAAPGTRLCPKGGGFCTCRPGNACHGA